MNRGSPVDAWAGLLLIALMRSQFSIAAALLVFVGCAQSPPGESSMAPEAPPETEELTTPKFELASSVEGKVVSVRSDLRYVVVDFSFSRLPQLGHTMGVYRGADRVGEVRITQSPNQALNGAMIADIKEGEVRPGDSVRAD